MDFYKLFNLKKQSHTGSQGWGEGGRGQNSHFQNGPVLKWPSVETGVNLRAYTFKS